MTVQPLKARRGSTRKAIAWAILVLMLAVACFDVFATPGNGKLGEQTRQAISQWPAAQQADKNWEWVRTLVYLVQIALNEQGFDPGKPDGLMGPNTMMALLAWRGEKGEPIATGLDPSLIIADIVAQLLHVTLETMGLSPGPRDQVLGQESTAALEDWSDTFTWGRFPWTLVPTRWPERRSWKASAKRRYRMWRSLRQRHRQSLHPVRQRPSPARGELWAAYTGYSFDRYAGDEGYGLAWNYPSKEEAIAEALKKCKQIQPPTPSSDHKQCGDDTWTISTTATPEVIAIKVPSERWYGFIRTWIYNARCFAVLKEITPAGVHIEVHCTRQKSLSS